MSNIHKSVARIWRWFFHNAPYLVVLFLAQVALEDIKMTAEEYKQYEKRHECYG